MKPFFIYLFGVGVLFICLACSSEQSKQTDNANLHVLMKPEIEHRLPERMPLSDVTARFLFHGKQCEAQVFRTADETLPKVKDEQGNEYVDNRIALRITSQGHTLVERTFTKQSFSSIISERFLQHAILEGLVYDTVSPRGMIFAASVSYPQSDLYVPIRLIFTADGQVSMETEELLDGYEKLENTN